MFELMVDRADAQLAFQTFEGCLDLGELHVAIPENRGIFGHQVGAQQIVTIA